MSDSLNFFNALRPKILELITRETADCLRMSPYVVSVPADPQTGLIGLTRITETTPSPVIFVPYHQSLSTAPAGTSVLLVYRGNLSNAYALPSF